MWTLPFRQPVCSPPWAPKLFDWRVPKSVSRPWAPKRFDWRVPKSVSRPWAPKLFDWRVPKSEGGLTSCAWDR